MPKYDCTVRFTGTKPRQYEIDDSRASSPREAAELASVRGWHEQYGKVGLEADVMVKSGDEPPSFFDTFIDLRVSADAHEMSAERAAAWLAEEAS